MIFLILVCTLIGYLCGSAVLGLVVGLALFALGVWAEEPYKPRKRPPRRR